jgi:hypothetical protein
LGMQDTGQTKQKTHQFVLLAIVLSVLWFMASDTYLVCLNFSHTF